MSGWGPKPYAAVIADLRRIGFMTPEELAKKRGEPPPQRRRDGKGSHNIWVRDEGNDKITTIVVPDHNAKDLGRGLLARIAKQAGTTAAELYGKPQGRKKDPMSLTNDGVAKAGSGRPAPAAESSRREQPTQRHGKRKDGFSRH